MTKDERKCRATAGETKDDKIRDTGPRRETQERNPQSHHQESQKWIKRRTEEDREVQQERSDGGRSSRNDDSAEEHEEVLKGAQPIAQGQTMQKRMGDECGESGDGGETRDETVPKNGRDDGPSKNGRSEKRRKRRKGDEETKVRNDLSPHRQCEESRQSRIEPGHSQSDRQLSKKPAAVDTAAADTRCSDTWQARRPSDG